MINNVLDLQVACSSNNIPTKQQFQLWVDIALDLAHKHLKTNNCQTDYELTLRIVSKKESQCLNAQYRTQDKPTNVLSFPFEVPEGITLNLLGDLIICADIIAIEAKDQRKSNIDHWAHIVIHGCLHLLGFDHISDIEALEMESLEIEILATLNIKEPY